MNRILDLKSKLTLLVLLAFMIALGAGEYSIIVERFVKVICPSCMGLG